MASPTRLATRRRNGGGVERLETDQGRADHAGVLAELGRKNPHDVASGRHGVPGDDLPHRIDQEVERLAEAAADDDQLRVQEADERGDARAQPAARSGDGLARRPVPLSRGRDQLRRAGTGAEQLPRRRLDGAARREGLEVTATGAMTLAERPVRVDDHVPGLRAGADPAAVEPPVEDQAAADAGAERDHHHVCRPAPGAGLPLRERGAVGVVVDRSGEQFGPDGYALNGKPLEDTYNEWRASRFAAAGVQCQDCHMPDRRHLWRGIHDADMVRGGLAISLTEDGARAPGSIAARLVVESTGVGHRFPTYVTPVVVLRAELIDAAGRPIEGTAAERRIAREVTLDLERELADTRLAPGGRAELAYARRLDGRAAAARFSVVVYPDAFYTAFFEALLRQGAGRGEARIREALAVTRRSPFTVFERDIPLT